MYRLWSGDVGYELEGICPYWVLGVTTCGRAPHVPWDDQAGTLAFSSDSKMLTMAGNWSAVANWDAASGGS
jgi:hypothetical protein